MKKLAILAAIVCSGAHAAASDGDWPGLRGPRHDGAAAGALESAGDAGFAVAWRSPLGGGYSSVAVAGGRAVTLFSDGKDDVAAAFDARTGRELWRYAIAPTMRGKDGSFDGPIATPVAAADRVYGLGPRGHLFAVQAATGREVWKVDLAAREGAPAPHYGYGASPVLAAGTLVVALGAKDGGALAGFDPATGARRWRLGDDVVAYQVPVVVPIGGRERVVVATETKLFVVDPASGRVLLEHAHGGESHPMSTESLVPVPAGEGRVFLKHRMDNSTMLRLSAAADDRVAVETLWTAPVLRQTYVIPVYHGGFLYGMSGRMTLTCVDAATGAQRWRSREPGDGFPMIVGDDLVVLTKESTLYVGRASPEGWTERARLGLFGDVAWSPLGFADGAFFARGQREIARVDWRASAPAAAASAAAPTPATPRFARFLAELAAAPDKAMAIDAFLASLPPGPLVEWPDRVVFLYRGPGTDIGLAADMNGARREDPMWRAAGTDLFWYESTLEPDARVSYHFVRDFEERLPDPRNPWRVPGHPSGTLGSFPKEQSSLAMPGWRASGHLDDAPPAKRGRLVEHVVESASRAGAKVALSVYLPAGYDEGRERLPVALLLDGAGARESGLVPRSLDNLMPGHVARTLVAFLNRPDWGPKPPSDDESAEALAELVSRDVLGFLDATYRTDPAPGRRAIVGAGFSAYTAAMVAFSRPNVFGALGLQSILMLDSDDELLRKQVKTAGEAPLRVYLDWGRYDYHATREAWSMRDANARFADFLRGRGYRPAGGEAMDGSGWASWRNRTDRLFAALFPPMPAPAAPAPSAR